MTYAYGYLAVGVLVWAVLIGLHRLEKRKNPEPSLLELMAQLDPERQRLGYRILNDFVAPALAAVAVAVAWPVAIHVQIKASRRKRSSLEHQRPVEPEFAVSASHLQECLTLAAIEARERVTDPLDAVPDVPFGHLHAVWQAFISEHLEDGDEIWTFAAPEPMRWRRQRIREGYAIVRHGVPVAHHVTRYRVVDDEALKNTAQQTANLQLTDPAS